MLVKQGRFFLCLLLAALLLSAGSPARAQEEGCRGSVSSGTAAAGAPVHAQEGGPLRLHVIARDDSREALTVKAAVRAGVAPLCRALTIGCGSAEEAFSRLQAAQGLVRFAAGLCARLAGSADPVRVEVGIYGFPEKTAGGLTLPAGEYRAVRVILGEGAGSNWWCVLFPGLCGEEAGAPMHSRLMGWLRELLRGWAA